MFNIIINCCLIYTCTYFCLILLSATVLYIYYQSSGCAYMNELLHGCNDFNICTDWCNSAYRSEINKYCHKLIKILHNSNAPFYRKFPKRQNSEVWSVNLSALKHANECAYDAWVFAGRLDNGPLWERMADIPKKFRKTIKL